MTFVTTREGVMTVPPRRQPVPDQQITDAGLVVSAVATGRLRRRKRLTPQRSIIGLAGDHHRDLGQRRGAIQTSFNYRMGLLGGARTRFM
jgi:hypothetical protein